MLFAHGSVSWLSLGSVSSFQRVKLTTPRGIDTLLTDSMPILARALTRFPHTLAVASESCFVTRA